jgi:hypothetical protein
MKTMLMKSVYGVALVGVLALACTLPLTPGRGVKALQPGGRDKSGPQAKPLEGTWRVQVTLRVCQTGAEIRTFPTLVTFAQGGTMTETTSAPRGPGHGVWTRKGGHAYGAVFEAFTFNPAGVWTGTQRVTQSAELGDDPDTFNAHASSELFDAGGALLQTDCSTAVGRRLE